MIKFDHFAVSGEDLGSAIAWVEETLGVALQPGGKHPHFGTHNQLLGLGPFYLEAIAIDPSAPAPDVPRWFNLDNFRGAPRITNWICAADDLDLVQKTCPIELGDVLDLRRDDLRWRFTNPPSGKPAYDGAVPAVIDWLDTPHPSTRLNDVGCRLRRFVIQHPQADQIAEFFVPHLDLDWLVIETGVELSFMAQIDTPHGLRTLQ
ncbi:VOC family protein [Algirhabdus cladophorae]|uniref:VOC family protein n=1 Tax=Algirhabdus cladophorae TaxID=3377108 RepID=UPI003B84B35C